MLTQVSFRSPHSEYYDTSASPTSFPALISSTLPLGFSIPAISPSFCHPNTAKPFLLQGLCTLQFPMGTSSKACHSTFLVILQASVSPPLSAEVYFLIPITSFTLTLT